MITLPKFLIQCRKETVECVETVEAEDINQKFGNVFRRPPTIAKFQTKPIIRKFKDTLS